MVELGEAIVTNQLLQCAPNLLLPRETSSESILTGFARRQLAQLSPVRSVHGCGTGPSSTAAGMQIGAHTLDSSDTVTAPRDLAHSEIAECRSRLEATLIPEIWAFAYPFGDPQSVTPEVLPFRSSAGFAAAFMNFGGGLRRSAASVCNFLVSMSPRQ